ERLQDVEISQRRCIDLGDVSEEEPKATIVSEVTVLEDRPKEILLKAIIGASSKPKVEIPMYEGTLKLEDLIDWIYVMDKYFEYIEVTDNKK
ncbi:hypothetical protein KI387_015051, partial [Taxus chinensis]